MDIQRRERIYDRLSEISMKMEIKVLPDSRYINEKLGQCHIFIEEVEKFFIEISKEMSIIQRAFNNALAGYETAQDDLISNDSNIMSLPSLKDREARANHFLKKELAEIKGYKNDLIDLENLQKAINVKLKNLGRVNMDIKIQMRLMDSQIRLGTPTSDSAAARSLAEELQKSTVGLDIFNQAETAVEETTIADPTEPLDVGTILTDIISIQETQPSVNALPVQENQPEERSIVDQLLNPLPTDPIDDLGSCMPEEIKTEEDITGSVIDLDKVLSPEPSAPIGGGTQKVIVEETKISTESKQKETPKPKNPNEIDIEALLSQFK